jgi:hypothetical protein
LLPSYFSEQGISDVEIERMKGTLDAKDALSEKIGIAKRHFSKLSESEAQQLCSNEWAAITAPSKSPQLESSALRYLLSLNSSSNKTLRVSLEMDRSCRISNAVTTPQR